MSKAKRLIAAGLIAAATWTASSCSPANQPSGTAQAKTGRFEPDASPEMQTAQDKFLKFKNMIITHLHSAEIVGRLAEYEKRLIRGDERVYKQEFPDLSDKQRANLIAGRSFDDNSTKIILKADGTIVGWLLNEKTGAWERAGYAAPEGTGVNEEEAYRNVKVP